MKKIAIIGTHGTGKTTICHDLVSALKKQDKNAEYLEELARNCPLPINEQTTSAAQEWIIRAQILKEFEAEHVKKAEYLICDRSVFDNYVYHLYSAGKSDKVDELVMEHVWTYDHLFKVPINPTYLKGDDIRSTGAEFQKGVDHLLDSELKKRGIPFHNYKSLKETLKIILG